MNIKFPKGGHIDKNETMSHFCSIVNKRPQNHGICSILTHFNWHFPSYTPLISLPCPFTISLFPNWDAPDFLIANDSIQVQCQTMSVYFLFREGCQVNHHGTEILNNQHSIQIVMFYKYQEFLNTQLSYCKTHQ